MAIITEYYKTRDDGTVLNRTYSDKGMLIERDGALYEDAVDPVDSGREYQETDTPIPQGDVTEEDYISALAEFGVKL